MDGQRVSALCVNLGHGSGHKVDGGETARAHQVLEIIRKRASETHPDVIFTQDTFADKYLRKIQEEIQNNVPCSEFSLSKVNIQGTDSVSIFVNTRKFELVNVDREARMVLEQQRRTKLNFLEETRYVVLQATSKTSGEKILLSSFHGKNNKASNGLKDELIRDFLIFTDLLAKKLKLEAILIGTDINRDMKSFSSGLPANISVFDFEFPDMCPTQCKRKAKPVIDYFLHSAALAPICSSARRFHEDETVLDHHPIHTVFQIEKGVSERSWDKEVVPRAANKQKRDLDKMGKGNLIDIPRENQSRPENKSGCANNIIPGASLSRAFNTPPPPLQSGKSISLAIGGIGDGKYNERFHSKAHFGANCIIPGSSTPPSLEASLQKTDVIVSDQASPKGKVKISGTKGNGVVSGLKFRKRQSQSHLCKRFYLLKLLSRKNDSRIYPSHALNQRVRPFL